MQQWAGRALHGSLAYGRSECRLVIRGHDLVAVLPDGQELQLPFRGIRFRRQGTAAKELVFDGGVDGSLVLTSTEESLLAALVALQLPDLDAAMAHHRSKARRGFMRRFIWPAVALALLFVVAPVLLVGPTTRLVMAAIPASADEALGRAALPSAVAEIAPGDASSIADPAIVGPVQRLVARLFAGGPPSPFHFDVRVYNSKVMNAFALPGGPIVVTTELLKHAHGADEVAGVIAHEMAHVAERHGMRQILQRMGFWVLAAALLGDVSGAMSAAVGAAGELTGLGFSRSMERDADELAVKRMRAAGMDSRALARFLEEASGQSVGSSERMPRFLSTHPVTTERVARINSLAGEAAHSRADDADWQALKARLD